MDVKKTLAAFILIVGFVLVCKQDLQAMPRYDLDKKLDSTLFNIENYGAVGDGNTKNTKAIQRTIDICASKGGGKVYVPKGIFIMGTIRLRSNVTIYLSPGSVLKGSNQLKDYEADSITNIKGLILANNVTNIGFDGTGIIHGNGQDPVFYSSNFLNGLAGRPNVFAFFNCEQIRFHGISVHNGARWNIDLKECNMVNVDNIQVISRVVANNDGLDLTDCQYVTISNSYFDCGDDAICPKSTTAKGTKNVVITNCIMKSESNAIKFGTSGIGGFQDISVTNCTIYDTRLSGIAIEMVDGGLIDGIIISNIVMRNVNGGIFIKLGKRNSKPVGAIRNVKIAHVIASGIGLWRPDTSMKYYKASANPKIGVIIAGLPGNPIENLSMTDIILQFYGNGNIADAAKIMGDMPADYPEYTNYGITPAYGINLRHVKDVTLNQIQLSYIHPDVRPAVFFENAKSITVYDLKAEISPHAMSFLRFKSIDHLFIHSNKPDAVNIPYLRFEKRASDVTIINNDLHGVSAVYVKDPGIKKDEIYLNNNNKK